MVAHEMLRKPGNSRPFAPCIRRMEPQSLDNSPINYRLHSEIQFRMEPAAH